MKVRSKKIYIMINKTMPHCIGVKMIQPHHIGKKMNYTHMLGTKYIHHTIPNHHHHTPLVKPKNELEK